MPSYYPILLLASQLAWKSILRDVANHYLYVAFYPRLSVLTGDNGVLPVVISMRMSRASQTEAKLKLSRSILVLILISALWAFVGATSALSDEPSATPFAQGNNGRDHNQFGFTVWLAGGGVIPGMIYGATDEWGYKAIENRAEMHDLHATILHLLGVDHTRSTFRFSGRDMRLTDVHGQVIHDIIA